MIKIFYKTVVSIVLLCLIACEFPDCSNIPDRYYDLYNDKVIHYVEFKDDQTFIHFYEKEGKKYSHTGEWWIKEGSCTVETNTWIVYGEKAIKKADGFGGIKFGTPLGNMLFWPYENFIEDNPDTAYNGFIRESYILTYKERVKQARIKDSLYWADTDTLYYKTGEIKEIGKLDEPYGLDKTPEKRGPWKEYYRNGILRGEGGYNGIKLDIWKYYYDTGELQAVGNYESGRKVGPWEYYYKSGVVKEKGIYIYIYSDSLKPEKKRGVWKYYNNKGKHIKTETFKSVEKSLDSIYRDRGWNEKFIPEDIENTKKDWYTPMEEYKAELKNQDSIAKLKR